jgi:hypothetical protein
MWSVRRLAYQELVGGVLAMRTEHFQLLNGYSNLYWGWGAEDDDMAYRCVCLHFPASCSCEFLTFAGSCTSVYKSLDHQWPSPDTRWSNTPNGNRPTGEKGKASRNNLAGFYLGRWSVVTLSRPFIYPVLVYYCSVSERSCYTQGRGVSSSTV